MAAPRHVRDIRGALCRRKPPSDSAAAASASRQSSVGPVPSAGRGASSRRASAASRSAGCLPGGFLDGAWRHRSHVERPVGAFLRPNTWPRSSGLPSPTAASKRVADLGIGQPGAMQSRLDVAAQRTARARELARDGSLVLAEQAPDLRQGQLLLMVPTPAASDPAAEAQRPPRSARGRISSAPA